jgi:hypothetical protein
VRIPYYLYPLRDFDDGFYVAIHAAISLLVCIADYAGGECFPLRNPGRFRNPDEVCIRHCHRFQVNDPTVKKIGRNANA